MQIPKLADLLAGSVVLGLVGAMAGASFYDQPALAQTTLSLNDSSILIRSPFRTGMNIGCANFYENCQIFGNLLGYSNPGMEPGTVRQVQDLNSAGAAKSFTDYNQYSIFPAGFWVGGNFQVVESISGGAENGCTGTIASSTGPNRAYVTAFSWDGTSVVTFIGANSFVAGASTVTIPSLQNGAFLVNKSGNVTSASTTSFSVTLSTPPRERATSSSGFGFVQTDAKYSAPVYTINPATNQGRSGCAGSFAAGDIVILSKTVSPTPESWWEGGYGGVFNSVVEGGAQMISDTTDLCATCGSQSLNLHFPSRGGTAQFWEYYDTNPNEDIFVLMNGTYQVSFWAKAGSGSPTLQTHAFRGGRGGFDCGIHATYLTRAWTQYTYSCRAAESSTGAGAASSNAGLQVIGSAPSGAADIYIDNVNFKKISPTDVTNNTVFRDEIVRAFRDLYPAPCSAPGTIRYWVDQNSETIDNWTRPDYARNPTGTGFGIYPGGQNSYQLSLEDFLVMVENIQTTTGCPVYPYISAPVTMLNSDAANLIEFLAAPASAKSSVYGQRRVALGQSAPWTKVFNKIYLSFCNECWNSSFTYQDIQGDHSGHGLVYYDYSVRSQHVFAAMRKDVYFQPNLKLGLDLQTATSFSGDNAIAQSHPDYVEIEDYVYGKADNYSAPVAIWAPLYFEVWLQMKSGADPHNFNKSWSDYAKQETCGANGKTRCEVNIYEQGEGTISGKIANSQNDLDQVNAGAGYGIAAALQFLIHQQLAPNVFGPQNYFALTEFRNGSAGSATAKLWGSLVDAGGASTAINATRYGGSYTPRPQFLAMQLANKSVIGPMFSCPIASNPTYNFAGSSTNGPSGTLPALSNVPYLYAFCFENGRDRSLVLFNTDIASSHAIVLTGANLPSGMVTQRQYAVAANPDAMNEAHSGTYTGTTSGTVNVTTGSIRAPSTLTLPAYSVTAIDYTADSKFNAGMPASSPAPASLPLAVGLGSQQSQRISEPAEPDWK
jgi:hypothetical protein